MNSSVWPLLFHTVLGKRYCPRRSKDRAANAASKQSHVLFTSSLFLPWVALSREPARPIFDSAATAALFSPASSYMALSIQPPYERAVHERPPCQLPWNLLFADPAESPASNQKHAGVPYLHKRTSGVGGAQGVINQPDPLTKGWNGDRSRPEGGVRRPLLAGPVLSAQPRADPFLQPSLHP